MFFKDGSSAPVSWLSTAFKTLSLDVILPGQKFDVIQSIALNDLSVTLQTQDQTFAPPTSSNFTLAKYKNPFGFALQVVESSQDIVLSGQGVDIAEVVADPSAHPAFANCPVACSSESDCQRRRFNGEHCRSCHKLQGSAVEIAK